MFVPAAVANVNTMPMKYGPRIAGLRPYASDNGAQIIGPKAKPNRKKVKPSVLTSVLTPKSVPIA